MMQVNVLCIDKILFSGQVNTVVLPGLFGKVGVKQHHSMMSVVLGAGEICLHLNGKTEKLAITEGIAHVNQNTVDVLLSVLI